MAKEWIDSLEDIYHNRGNDGSVNKPYVKKLAKELVKPVDREFPIGIDYSSPDYVFRENLKGNIYKFSVAKNYNDSIKLSNLLLRPDGSVRPWNEFKKEARFVVGDSNRYLRTEYSTIIAGARMSRLWQEIQRDKHIFPYVQLKIVSDDHTSDICEPLRDLIFEVDDPVLQHFFPPNHFNCRTTAIKLRNGPPSDNFTLPRIPEAFQNNVGKNALLFTDKNAYIENTPEDILKISAEMFWKQNRNEAMDFAKENLIGKNVLMTDNKKIDITAKGFKHFLNQIHDDLVIKNALTYDLEQHLKTAKFIKTSPDNKGRRQFTYHYYRIAGHKNMIAVIREVLNNRQLQFYSVVQKIK